MARQTTFYNAKAVEVSTPTIKNASAIEASYYMGTMERWCTACPHCGKHHEIRFADIQYEHEEIIVAGRKTYKVTSVFYICPDCGAVSSESEMKKQPSRWGAESPDAYEQGVRSFWLNAFVSVWASWKSIILKYLNAIGSSRKLQVVYNTCFGERVQTPGSKYCHFPRRDDYVQAYFAGLLSEHLVYKEGRKRLLQQLLRLKESRAGTENPHSASFMMIGKKRQLQLFTLFFQYTLSGVEF